MPPSRSRLRLSPSGTAVTVVTNFIKLGGLVVAINEALIRAELRPTVLAVAAFMMAGAQGIEQLFTGLFGQQSSGDKDDS